jgi:hypothetical protein
LFATFRIPTKLVRKHAVYVPLIHDISWECPFIAMKNLRFLDISHDILIDFLKKPHVISAGQWQ